MKCKNCGTPGEGNYCSNCGQRTDTGKLSLPVVLQDLSSNIFQVERGFFYTVKSLFVRPGNMIHEYLEGKRKPYFRPFSYIIFFSTFYFLVTKIVGESTWLDDFLTGFSHGGSHSERATEIVSMLDWFAKNYAYTTLLLLPVFSVASRISFLKSGRNYAEHLVLNSYITGQQAIFYSFFVFLSYLVEFEYMEFFAFGLSMGYLWVIPYGYFIDFLRKEVAY
ncbi:DUF3667 domain-containing protein [Gracilimonas mengyeensis]|uniref:DUF3667 domain-containing protein n=1 Tax=Gracilimonas mengyeensis TaxID=1302730 RepID=A0A521DWS8_9BACT|nr:DUF3667 domain-containing protein [Gracilimonas mengyeensis]SMO76157.1 Protein of unknown function [Gracilimonas mengyeensis]